MENKKLILEQKITKLAVEQLMEKYNAGQIDEAGLASAIGGLKNLAGKVANKFVDKAQQVKQGLSDVGTEIKGTIKHAGSEIADTARGAVKSVSDTTQNIKQGAVNTAGQIKTAYKQGALPVQRQETEKAFETFAKALNAYNQEARKYSAEPLSIQGMLNKYRRTYPNLFKESEEPILNSEPICESEDKWYLETYYDDNQMLGSDGTSVLRNISDTTLKNAVNTRVNTLKNLKNIKPQLSKSKNITLKLTDKNHKVLKTFNVTNQVITKEDNLNESFEKTDAKKDNKLKKKLGLEDNEKLTIGRVNSELKKLKDKCKDGEKLSKEDSTFEKELNLAKTLLSSKK